MRHALIIALALGLSLSSFWFSDGVKAQTSQTDCIVFGAISIDTTWEPTQCDPYIVGGNLRINEGVTLTIRPGTMVRVNRGFMIEVAGTLIARGTPQEPITLTSNQSTPGPGDWQGLVFTQTSTGAQFDAAGTYLGGTILQYAVLEYAGHNGLDDMFASITGYAIFTMSQTLMVDHSVIRHTNGIAIMGSGDAARITNNLVTNNGNTGLELSYREIILTGNTITQNGESIYGDRALVGGVKLASSEWTLFSNNLIADNRASSVAGGVNLRLSNGSALVRRSVIRNNQINDAFAKEGVAGGLVIYNDNDVDDVVEVYENVIRDNSARSSAASGGIEVLGQAILRDNILLDNLVGEGEPRDLVCSGSRSTVTATDNYWGVDTPIAIEQRILHFTDDGGRCQAPFEPFRGEPPTIPTPAPAPGLVGNDVRGQPGSVFTFSGGGFPANSPIELFVNALPLGTVQSDRDGNFRFQLTTDQSELRTYQLKATAGRDQQALAGITLEADAPRHSQAAVDPSFALAAAMAQASTLYTPTVVPSPLPAGYQSPLPQVIIDNLGDDRLIPVTNTALAGSYIVAGVTQNIALDIHVNGRIYIYDLTTVLVTGKPVITMKAAYQLDGNWMTMVCPDDSPYCGIDIRRTDRRGDAWIYLIESQESDGRRGLFMIDGQTQAVNAFYKLSDEPQYLVVVPDPNPPPLIGDQEQSSIAQTPTRSAIPSSPPIGTEAGTIAPIAAASPIATTAPLIAVSPVALGEAPPGVQPAVVPIPTSFRSYLPWAYRGLLVALGLLWVFALTHHRQRLSTSLRATFQSGAGHVRQMSLKHEQVGLEQQLAQTTTTLGAQVWEQQVTHPSYLPLFEQLATLCQQRTVLRTEEERLETVSQQTRVTYDQRKADFATRTRTAQDQQKAAAQQQRQSRMDIQSAEKQIERISAEQQKLRSEILSMRQRLTALNTTTANDRDEQATALNNGIAALEQRLNDLKAQEPSVQAERTRLQGEQGSATEALATAEQMLTRIQEEQRQVLTPLEQQREELKGQLRQTHEAISAHTLQIESTFSELGTQAAQVRPEAPALAAFYDQFDQLQQRLRDHRHQIDLLNARQAGLDRSAPRTVVLLLVALVGTILAVAGAIWWL